MQDTLMSSNANNELTKVMSMSCCSHINKKATFIIKGKPYCDKCSVKFITKGHIAIRIK
jgi:hypothetical protein